MTPFTKGFDDLREGDRFTTRGRTVTEADVTLFAALSGDTHPQHTDAEWAAGSRFGRRIAHGMLVLSYAAGLVPFDPERVVALRRVSEVVFKQPVYIGDTIRVEGELAALRALDEGHGLVTCRLRVLGADGRLAARAAVEVVWRREREPQAAPAAEDAVPEPLLI
jgi:acyl dehydratase